jgi:hypothetical protein
MDDVATAHSAQEPLAPLVGLVERLRGEVMGLQEQWEALGEELEAKRRSLKLAEATIELLQRRQDAAAQEGEDEEAQPAGGWALRVEDEAISAQASVGCMPCQDEYDMT